MARAQNLLELDALAREKLPPQIFDFIAGAAEDEITLARNREAWQAIHMLPRVLVDVSTVDTSTTVLGQTIPSPVVLAPVAGLDEIERELRLRRSAVGDDHAQPVPCLALGLGDLEEFLLRRLGESDHGALLRPVKFADSTRHQDTTSGRRATTPRLSTEPAGTSGVGGAAPEGARARARDTRFGPPPGILLHLVLSLN